MTTTATQWIEEHPGDWEVLLEAVQDAGLSIELLTELPPWMKRSIMEQLEESFAQPYWDNIAKTTLGDAEKFLRQGLEDGWSIQRIANEMSYSFQGHTHKYAMIRARNIARTESGNALNGARRAGMDGLLNELPSEMTQYMKPTWLSVLGTTTRDSHASLDGVPADKDGRWLLGGQRIPWPGYYSLPPGERCNCQCSIVMDWGIQEEEAQELIQDYMGRGESNLGKSFKHLPGQHDQSTHGRGGGGDFVSVETLRGELKADPATGRLGTKEIGSVQVEAFRVGSVEDKHGRGVFFSGDREGAEAYASLHEGYDVKKYDVSLDNVLLAGHQNDVTRLFFHKPYGEMIQDLDIRYGGRSSVDAGRRLDVKIAREAKKRKFDGIIYLQPAPPANSEVAVFGKGKWELSDDQKSFKHLPGQHDQGSHGRGGSGRVPSGVESVPGLSKTLETVKKGTGYTDDEIRDALTGDCSPKNSERALKRAKIVGAIYASGTGVKDAVVQVFDSDSEQSKNALVKKLTSGKPDKPIAEFSSVPEYDIKILSSISQLSGPAYGEANCQMATRRIEVGSTTRSGSYRHELGHAVRSAMGGDSHKSKRIITKAVAEEYNKVMQKVKKDPVGLKKKLSHEEYEKKYGVVGRRGIDNWEENFAEHYRLYHREAFRDRNEGGGGKYIAQYRERHSGMAKVWDAWYTGALLGRKMQ